MLPADTLGELRRLALEQKTSLAGLINRAIEKVYFPKRQRKCPFRALRGAWPGDVSESDIASARIRSRDIRL